MQNELMALLPQLQLPNIELWQVLTWEQGSAVITNIELLNWLDNLQQQGQGDSYLFTRVVGNWDEKFLVTVSLADGVELTLPPFTFYPGRSH